MHSYVFYSSECLIYFLFQMTIGKNEELPPLPEPEGTQLKNHLKQVMFNPIMHLKYSIDVIILNMEK